MTTVLTLKSNLLTSIILALLSVSLLAASPSTAWSSGKDLNFKSLQTQLINDKNENFTKKKINGIFNNSGVNFDIEGISSYFRQSRSRRF